MSLSADFHLNTLKDTYEYSCFLARLDEYRHLMTESLGLAFNRSFGSKSEGTRVCLVSNTGSTNAEAENRTRRDHTILLRVNTG
jgi:hypothetical protein